MPRDFVGLTMAWYQSYADWLGHFSVQSLGTDLLTVNVISRMHANTATFIHITVKTRTRAESRVSYKLYRHLCLQRSPSEHQRSTHFDIVPLGESALLYFSALLSRI